MSVTKDSFVEDLVQRVKESLETQLIYALRETANRIINDEIERTMRRLTIKCHQENDFRGDKLVVQFELEEPKHGDRR